MKDYISDRVITLAEYIIENKATVRSAYLKNTHTDVTITKQ